MAREGQIKVQSEKIFPIIKKWLYSDKDIFLRELVSNASDAIKKLERLNAIGEADTGEEKGRIEIQIDPEAKTLSVSDNGIGMTEDEVEKYITQIAFSGAEDFIEKYKDKTDAEAGIIGHFGLGFYSAFMVSDSVEIDTLSYQPGAKPVHWVSDGSDTYEIGEGARECHGTTITLHIGEDSKEFLEEFRLREMLHKYCHFMPYEIYFYPKKKDLSQKEEKSGEESKTEEKPVNNTQPLWLKKPKDCTKEEYESFYREVFMDFNPPLFWIHLNVDYPFNLKGILYFPQQSNKLQVMPGEIKLYNNQVYIADNIKEVVPEYLMLLKGVIDCPDLPLNVSRSFLQNDGDVQKISRHITKKVSDKLHSVFEEDRASFEGYWEDIAPFIKFGCIKDDKFNEKMKDYIIYKDLDGKYISLDEYLEAAKDKHENQVFYVTDELQQSQYINMFREQGLNAVILKNPIDQPFISRLEEAMKDKNVKFRRIDTDLADVFKETASEDDKKVLEEDQTKLTDIFKKALGVEALDVKVEKLKNADTSAMITLSEDMRRMQDMMKMYGMSQGQMGTEGQTLVLNANNALVQYVLNNPEGEHVNMFCQQIYDLALLSHCPLSAEAMTKFVARSNEILKLLAK